MLTALPPHWRLSISRSFWAMQPLLVRRKLLEWQYSRATHQKLDLENPVLFNEKMQWYKLHYRNPLMPVVGDKWAVREYLQHIGYGELLNKQYAAAESVDGINWDLLPRQFVVKVSHDSGGIFIVRDKSQCNISYIKRRISRRLGRAYGGIKAEWYYLRMTPKVLVHEYLEDKSGELMDYKVHCFSGKPRYVQVDLDRYGEHRQTFYDLNWTNLRFNSKGSVWTDTVPRPRTLDQMLKTSEKLSEPFPYVRMDYYSIDSKLYFGEFTFFHNSGMAIWTPAKWDAILGSELVLPRAGTGESVKV